MKTKNTISNSVKRSLRSINQGIGSKNISKSMNIPQSKVKSIIKKWKKYGTYLLRAGYPYKLSDTHDYSEGVKSFGSWDKRDSVYNICSPGSSHAKAFMGEWQKKVSVEESSWNLYQSCTKRHVGVSKVFGHQTGDYVWRTPNTAYHHKHTRPGDGSILLQGCFSAAGPRWLVMVERVKWMQQNIVILEDNLIMSA